jgi:uncharacterized membrane protein
LELQQQLILANDCWAFLNGIVACFLVLKFRRRTAFITSTSGMCLILVTVIVCSTDGVFDSGTSATILFLLVFLFSPFYNIAFNALTYSNHPFGLC